jgi:ADP-ribose pyrophosphatase
MRFIVNGVRRIYEGFFDLREVDIQFEKFDGTLSDEVKRLILYKNEAAAALLFLVDTQELVLVRQFRTATTEIHGGWIDECIAGGIEHGEDPKSAIIREINEEAGYDVRHIDKIASFYVSPGITNEFLHLFMAYANRTQLLTSPVTGDPEEDIQLVFIHIDSLDDLIESGSIIDAKTIIAIHHVLRMKAAETLPKQLPDQ